MNDEFYIGWDAKAAPGIGKTVRRAVAVLLLIALLVPVTLAISQRMIGASVFEWGNVKNFSGILQATPYPHLLVPRPNGGKFHALQSVKKTAAEDNNPQHSKGDNADFHTLQSVEENPAGFSSYYLVAPWKFGLKPEAIAPRCPRPRGRNCCAAGCGADGAARHPYLAKFGPTNAHR